MNTTKYLLPKDGQFFKANLHCHSTLSDGFFTPEQLKEAYLLRGYSIVAFTDHRVCVDHSDLTDGHFLALTGSEIDNLSDPAETVWQKACHLCCISREPKTHDPMLQLGQPNAKETNEIIQKLNDSGFIVHYNHPAWSAHSAADFGPMEGVKGFEIYNHCSQAYAMEGVALNEYALYLKAGRRSYPIAADDNHNQSKNRRYISDSFGGFTMIKAPELTYQSIIAALDAGHVYASTGPEIYEYTLTGKTLHIVCSPVCKAILKTARVGVNKQNVIMPSDVITQADFDLTDAHGFAHIELYAQDQRFACTAPVYEDEWQD